MEEKMDKFIVNIIHRPEMVPEYAEKVTGHGKEEDLGRKALLTESLDIFKFQQETAHKNGLKTTIQMTYASLFNDEAVALAKADHEKYGAKEDSGRLVDGRHPFSLSIIVGVEGTTGDTAIIA